MQFCSSIIYLIKGKISVILRSFYTLSVFVSDIQDILVEINMQFEMMIPCDIYNRLVTTIKRNLRSIIEFEMTHLRDGEAFNVYKSAPYGISKHLYWDVLRRVALWGRYYGE